MRLRRYFMIGFWVSALSACGELEVGQRGEAIVNGEVEVGYAAVGVLVSAETQACTATLIGDQIVLTAAP